MSGEIQAIEDDLRRIADEFAQAESNISRLRHERTQAVVRASGLGLSRRRVAELAGITGARVQQILDIHT